MSICIPTYNRSKQLGECLDSVLSSMKEHENEVEIVISDNASTDNTQALINRYNRKHLIIRYHRNDENLGGENNFYIAAEKASGEYVWILADDDKIADEAISNILERISSGYNLIISNYSRWSRDFSFMWKQSGLPFQQDAQFNDPNELMKHIGLHLGYISSIIVKRDVLLSTPYNEYQEYNVYYLSFLYLVYAGIAKDCHATYVSTPLVHNRSGNSPIINWFHTFIMGPLAIFKALLAKGFSPNAIYCASNRLLKEYAVPHLILRKSLADTDLKRLAGLLAPYYRNNWVFWIVCIPVLYIPVPSFFMRIALKLAKGIRKR